MKTLLTAAKKSFIVFVLLVQVMGYSAFSFSQVAFADDTPAPVSEAGVTYAPCPAVNGNSSPTGSAAHTYSFNPATCIWENLYYSWSPSTKQYVAKYDQTPVLNSSGTAWEYLEWYFSAGSGVYAQRTVSIPVPVVAAPPPVSAPSGTSTINTPGQPGVNGAQSQLLGGSTIDTTGANSSNNISNNNNVTGNLNYDNTTNVITSLDSSATSGNAYVLQNTNGGSAETGDAETIANFLNMIQSAWNPANGNINTFNAGLYGNFNGDLLFNPDKILTTGYSSDNAINNSNNTDLTVNSSDKASIQNDINLEAISGNATVSENTNAGDATTGDANTVANVMNLINSSINSSGSFIGSLNIYGDLTGDILLPPSILAQLRNTGANSNNAINNTNDTDLDLTVNKNNGITNNLDLAASSGNSVVQANTNAGDAVTGNATTQVNQANIIGGNSSGTKGLLVFVNVLGKWVGMMYNPSSSIADTGAYSSNTVNNNNSTDVDANFNQDFQITNNINLNAQSGDATVSKNTNAGSATSGNASSSVNLLNVIDSNLNFSDWFGVLFINVFGSWDGSFGVDTASGNNQPTVGGKGGSSPESSTGTTAQTSASSATTNAASNAVRVASSLRSSISRTASANTVDQATSSATTTQGNITDGTAGKVASVADAQTGDSGISLWIPISGTIFAVLLLGSKQILAFGRRLLNQEV